MPFVKVKTTLRDNVRKLSVSRSAALAYYDGLTLIEELAVAGGRLGYFEYRDLGTLTARQLSIKLHVAPAELKKITAELIGVGLWERDGDSLRVPRFAEATTPADPRAAERVRKFRERQRQNATQELPLQTVTDTVTDTVTETVGNAVTETPCNAQTSKTLETSTTTVAAKASTATASEKKLVAPQLPRNMPETLPADIGALKILSVEFLAAFANARSPEARKKHGDAYVEALAIFRSRGISVADTWRAFSDAWLARDGEPLFGSLAKKAVAFIAARPAIGNGRVVAAGSFPVTISPEDRE